MSLVKLNKSQAVREHLASLTAEEIQWLDTGKVAKMYGVDRTIVNKIRRDMKYKTKGGRKPKQKLLTHEPAVEAPVSVLRSSIVSLSVDCPSMVVIKLCDSQHRVVGTLRVTTDSLSWTPANNKSSNDSFIKLKVLQKLQETGLLDSK